MKGFVMLMSILKKNSVKMSFSFLMGAMVVLIFGFQDNKGVMDLEQIKEITYADISIDIVDDVNYLGQPDIVEYLRIKKKDYPFIYLFKNPSNKIVKWNIVNGKEGPLAFSKFDKDRISEFSIYGNKVHDKRRMPVFFLRASDKPGVWQKAMYTPTLKAIEEKGKLISYRAIGEWYEDIDFDGQFDAKRIYNEESEIVYEYIFVNGEWLTLDDRDLKEKMTKIGHYSLDRLDAVTFDGKQKTYYDFEIGKGWKKRPPTRSNNQ
ncbi:MAG: hypothetical protein PVH77_02285 [Phycisphaerales bacterium]|jgi:hypothetical protein